MSLLVRSFTIPLFRAWTLTSSNAVQVVVDTLRRSRGPLVRPQAYDLAQSGVIKKGGRHVVNQLTLRSLSVPHPPPGTLR